LGGANASRGSEFDDRALSLRCLGQDYHDTRLAEKKAQAKMKEVMITIRWVIVLRRK
jgi:hypothetical protein